MGTSLALGNHRSSLNRLPPEPQQPSAPQLGPNNQNGIGGFPPPPPNPPDSSSPFPDPETPPNTPSPVGQGPDASSAPNHNGDSSGVSPDVNHGPAPRILFQAQIPLAATEAAPLSTAALVKVCPAARPTPPL